MQAIPVIAGIILLGLVGLSGFQLVPASVVNGSFSDQNSDAVERDTDDGKPASSDQLTNGAAVDATFDPVITTVTVHSTQDIEQTTATLRGRVVAGPETLGTAFFVYSYNLSDLRKAVQQSNSYDELLEKQQPTVQTERVSRRVSRTDDVSAKVRGLVTDTNYYARLCLEVESTLRCSSDERFETLQGPTRVGNVQIPTIRVTDEELLSDEEITLTVRVRMRDSEDGRVYIVYGQSQSAVEQAFAKEYGDIDENDEQLQTERMAVNLIGNRTLMETIEDLEAETKYYYTACVSYEGLRDGVVCESIDSFTMPEGSFGKAPLVYTDEVMVAGTTALLSGSVNMRSFSNGKVFFVYGTDVRRISELTGERQMTDIRQNGDRLQRVSLDNNFFGNVWFETRVEDLMFSTQYVARMCVEFENVDERNRSQLFVECAEVREFVTS